MGNIDFKVVWKWNIWVKKKEKRMVYIGFVKGFDGIIEKLIINVFFFF